MQKLNSHLSTTFHSIMAVKISVITENAVLPWLKGLTECCEAWFPLSLSLSVCRYRPGSDDVRGPALARVWRVFLLRLLSAPSAGQTLPASPRTHLLLPLLLARGRPRQLRLLRFCPTEQTSVTQDHSKPAAHFHTSATGGSQRQSSQHNNSQRGSCWTGQ